MKEKSKELGRKLDQAHREANARRQARSQELLAKVRFNSELPLHVAASTPLFDPKQHEAITASARKMMDELSDQPAQATPLQLSHERKTTPKK